MYARGINDSALIRGEDHFLHIVSCNTHNLAVICQTIGFPPEAQAELRGEYQAGRRGGLPDTWALQLAVAF